MCASIAPDYQYFLFLFLNHLSPLLLLRYHYLNILLFFLFFLALGGFAYSDRLPHNSPLHAPLVSSLPQFRTCWNRRPVLLSIHLTSLRFLEEGHSRSFVLPIPSPVARTHRGQTLGRRPLHCACSGDLLSPSTHTHTHRAHWDRAGWAEQPCQKDPRFVFSHPTPTPPPAQTDPSPDPHSPRPAIAAPISALCAHFPD